MGGVSQSQGKLMGKSKSDPGAPNSEGDALSIRPVFPTVAHGMMLGGMVNLF